MKITRKRRWVIKECCVECNQLVKHKTRNFKELCEDNETLVISREKERPKYYAVVYKMENGYMMSYYWKYSHLVQIDYGEYKGN